MTSSTIKPNSTLDSDPGYGQFLAVLWRQRLWFIAIFLPVLALSVYHATREAPVYNSSMQLLVEPNYQGKGQEQAAEFADSNVVIDTATQINLMQSSGLVQRAMKSLQDNYPEINPNDAGSVSAFRSGLAISQMVSESGATKGETKIFQIAYTSNDPVKTQAVLKALKQVYLDYNLEQQRQRLDRGLAFINEQLPQIREKLQQSEAALERFRRDQELIDPEGEAKTQAELYKKLQQDQQTNLMQIRELRQKYESLQQQLSLSPEEAAIATRLSQSPRYQNLLSRIQESDLALAQLRVRFTDETLAVQQLVDQRARQLNLLKEEAGRIIGETGRSTNELVAKGQLSELDLTLVPQLINTQVELQTAIVRYNSLSSTAQQVRENLKRFPQLLAAYGRLQPEVDLNRETWQELLKARQSLGLEIARGGFDWQVVEEPQLGAALPSSMTRNLLVGIVAGLFLGGIAAFAREAADDAVRSSEELKKQVAVPLLGIIPELVPDARSNAGINLPFSRPRELPVASIDQILHWQPMRESLDLLYQNIQLANHGSPLKSLVITSALPGEGKSTLILGLAISAARLHRRVLLIDADLRRPSLHKILGLPNDQGLSNLLTSETPIPQVIDTQNSSLRGNIAVLTSGPIPNDPAKLLSSQRMQEMMASFEQAYDLILLDAPPVLGMVDTSLVASCANGVLMVGRIGRVSRNEVNQAIASLDQLNLVGVVANGATHLVHTNVFYQPQPS